MLAQPTVPMSLYDAMVEATEEPFADSYLWGAYLQDGKLTPHTQVAHDRLMKDPAAMRVLGKLGIVLVKPDPFPGKPPRQAFAEVYPEMFGGSKRGRAA